MRLTIENLERGISWWEKKEKWPQDFHNGVYYELYALRNNGLTPEWWGETVNRLWDWRAIRSKTPPNTKDEIRKRGLRVLTKIRKYYTKIRRKVRGEPVFIDYKWHEIEGLYDELVRIKGSRSPNFPSKLGHFIYPKLFIVRDHQATGVEDYTPFWSSMSEAWERFSYKKEARKILTRTIRNQTDRQIHEHYPFEIKIIELCIIGSRHG
ncbi:MAG: hypothetical protein AB1610_05465 [Nitrospirota bacterium]